MNSNGERVAKAAIRLANFAVDLFVILVVLILLGFGVYSIWDTQQIYTASDSAQYETYKPAADEEDSLSFSELQAINSDVLGWITLYGTGVDYPLVQGENNDVYMNSTVTGEFSLGGAIFLDYSNAPDFTDFNTIIYGHHMEQSEMFGDIDKFDDETYWNEHLYGNLYYSGRNHGLEIFAMIDADAYDFTLYNAQVTDGAAYLAYLQSIARYWRGDTLGVSADDHIIMMSTCADTSTNGRYVLFARIVDNTFEDTFAAAADAQGTVVTRTLTIPGTQGEVPVLYLVIAIILVALILLILLLLQRRNKRQREEALEEEEWQRRRERSRTYDREHDREN